MLADIRSIGELLLVSFIVYHIEYSTGHGSGICSNKAASPDELFNQRTCQAHLYVSCKSPRGWLSSKILSKFMYSINAIRLVHQTKWRSDMVRDHAVQYFNLNHDRQYRDPCGNRTIIEPVNYRPGTLSKHATH